MILAFALLTSFTWAQDRVAIPNAVPVSESRAADRQVLGEVAKVTCEGRLTRDGQNVPLTELPVKIYENDELKCGANGNLVVKMIDKSELTLYGNSGLKLNKYLLRDQNVGTFAMSLLGGTFHFASQAFKSPYDRYAIETHTTTIGVRGTIFTIEILKDKSTLVQVERGEVRVKSKSNHQEKFVKSGQKLRVY